jgi:cbb3-type cytochrome oxidase subunit 3
MFKNLIQSIEGVEVYGIIGLVIFLLFFIGITVWLIKIDKNYIDKMKGLPLEPDNNEVSGKGIDFQNLTGGKNED